MAAALQSVLAELKTYVQNLETKVSNMDSNIGIRFTNVEGTISGMNATMGAAQSVTVAGMQEISGNSGKTIAQIKADGEHTIQDIKK